MFNLHLTSNSASVPRHGATVGQAGHRMMSKPASWMLASTNLRQSCINVKYIVFGLLYKPDHINPLQYGCFHVLFSLKQIKYNDTIYNKLRLDIEE